MKRIFNLCFFIGLLAFTVTGCNNGTANSEQKVVEPPTEKKTTDPANADFLQGKTYYSQYCMVCHQQDGKGVPGLNPPLVRTEWVLGDKERLIGVVLNGLNEEIEINGESFNNAMGSFASLSDKEIALTLSFVRQSFGNDATLITEKEVADVRKSLNLK